VTSRAVGAEADTVVGAAKVRLILGVPVHVTNLVHAVRELALVAVLAGAVLLEGAAHLGLVPRGLLAVVTDSARLLLLLWGVWS